MIFEYITYILWAVLLALFTSTAVDVQTKKTESFPRYLYPPMVVLAVFTGYVFSWPFALVPVLLIPVLAGLTATAYLRIKRSAAKS